jgi:hypothetical protein
MDTPAKPLMDTKWTPILLTVSLFCFFYAVALLGSDGFGALVREHSERVQVIVIFMLIALLISWASFFNALRFFRDYDDKRWAWFYAIFTDVIATLITVAGLYTIYSLMMLSNA